MYDNYVIDPNVYGEAVANALERKKNQPIKSCEVPEKVSTKAFLALLWVSLMLFMFSGPFILAWLLFGWMIP